MRFTSVILAGGLSLASTVPAFAQDAVPTAAPSVSTGPDSQTAPPSAITISGTAGIYTDYRLRGVSQSDKNGAAQVSLTVAHESGFYIGTFASNLSGWGTFGGANVELDAIGGFKKTFGSATVDGGVTWYTYPGGFSESDVVEFYGKLSGTYGPLGLTAGVFYAPTQTSLGRIYESGPAYGNGVVSPRAKRWDNLYLTGDGTMAIPGTPLTGRAHIGYSKGNPGLGPNGTSLSPTGEYFDWNAGVDWNFYKNLTISATYIDTDIGKRESFYLAPNFRKVEGGLISDATVVFSLVATF